MPALPDLAASFGAGDALAQSTMAACMLGLGVGQLISGPMSDRFGRRRPMLIGLSAFVVFSIACVFAPTIEWLLVFRALQGVGGAAGLVITLAIVRDLAAGADLSRLLSRVVLIGTVILIAAPVLSGQLMRVTDWRGIFLVLGGIGAALLLATLAWLPESLESERRSTGGGLQLVRDARVLLGSGHYRYLLLIAAIAGSAFFSYVSMSALVLQNGFGLSPQSFGAVIAIATACNVLGVQASAMLVRRFAPLTLYRTGLSLGLAGGLLTGLSALLGWGLWPFIAGLWIFSGAAGFRLPNQNSLALSDHGARAGSAAALLGTTSFIVGPLASSLISALGVTARTLGVTMAVAGAIAFAIGAIALRPRRTLAAD